MPWVLNLSMNKFKVSSRGMEDKDIILSFPILLSLSKINILSWGNEVNHLVLSSKQLFRDKLVSLLRFNNHEVFCSVIENDERYKSFKLVKEDSHLVS